MNNLKREIQRVAEEYTTKLRRLVPQESGALKNSINYNLTENGFEVDALEYLDYLDKGVNGINNRVGSIYSYTTKKPPIGSLKGWANRKGINVWALQNSIYNNGIRPRNFLGQADTEIDINAIVEAYSKDIDDMFNDL